MIEGNPFVDTDASTVPGKGGAAVKSAARSNGNRIANEFDWNNLIKAIGDSISKGFEMGGQIAASKNGAAATTPTVTVQKKDNTATWVLVGIVVVALIVGLLFFMKKRK